ncbi:MAG: hypothetical protein ACRYGC_16390 [Janthinobacterium lividum]
MRSRAAVFRLPGLLLAVLALACQLAAGALAPVDAAAERQVSELAAAMGQCRGAAPGEHGRQRRAPDCALAVAEVALPAFVAPVSPVVPEPAGAVAVRRASVVSARAPPSHGSHAGLPRGPPALA